MSLSADGKLLAVGAVGRYDKKTRVFGYNSTTETWTQRGQSIAYGGDPVALSADGSVLAIGDPFLESSRGYPRGAVHVFKWNSTMQQWLWQGSSITGERDLDWSGSHLSLSANGSVIAIGAAHNDGGGLSSGHVRYVT